MDFTPNPECDYKYNYEQIFGDIANGLLEETATFKQLILTDLFFLIYFVMKVDVANHPFVVEACKEVELGPKTKTLELWAREHFKSTILTTAEVVQKLLKDPEKRFGIFSHTRPIAKGFLRGIKLLLESSELLKECFPEVLYMNPHAESPKWSEDDGLIVKRKGFPREASIEAWGLLEGMPTSKHFTDRIYDDIETADNVENPDIVRKLINKFDLSQNLGTLDGTERIIGTYYSHQGVLKYINEKKNIHGDLIYQTRLKPATDDGTANGIPVLLSEEKMDELRANEYAFNCQQLLNPTPTGQKKLDATLLHEIEHDLIPRDVFKFMIVDPAGDDTTGKGDAWGILMLGVEPQTDDIGASKVYIMDACISPMRVTEAIDEITRMYLRSGVIMQMGVEKSGISTTEMHIATALEKHGRHLSTENENLVILKPAGRKKIARIEGAIAWPLLNNKIFISNKVKSVYADRLRDEMEKFPFWHDDGLDALSYLYDIIKDYRFARRRKHKAQWRPRIVNDVTGY